VEEEEEEEEEKYKRTRMKVVWWNNLPWACRRPLCRLRSQRGCGNWGGRGRKEEKEPAGGVAVVRCMYMSRLCGAGVRAFPLALVAGATSGPTHVPYAIEANDWLERHPVNSTASRSYRGSCDLPSLTPLPSREWIMDHGPWVMDHRPSTYSIDPGRATPSHPGRAAWASHPSAHHLGRDCRRGSLGGHGGQRQP
jgi:hypothetical protein